MTLKANGGHVNAAFDDGGEVKGKTILPSDSSSSPLADPDGTNKSTEGEQPQRDNWSNPVEFLLSCISMSVGLGIRMNILH